MQLKMFLVIMMISSVGCKSRGPDATAASGLLADEKDYWITLEVTGDANCPPWRPEPLNLVIRARQANIESVNSASTVNLAFLLKPPFQPNRAEAELFTNAEADRSKLADVEFRTTVETAATKVFTRAFPTPFLTQISLQYLRSANLLSVRVSHTMTVADLIAYQEWLISMVPKYKEMQVSASYVDYTRFNLPRGNPEIGVPFLIFGKVIQTPLPSGSSNTDRFKVSFDPSDTIVTGGAQNEAFDTTLCQLRKGIVSGGEKHDIPVFRVLSVAPVAAE